MTAMIDIVFLLLIFFLVTSTFFRPERQLSPSIAVQQHPAAVRQRDLQPAVIDLYLDQNRTWYRLGGHVMDDATQLAEILRNYSHKNDGAYVRAADDVDFQYTANAVSLVRASGFTQVHLVPP